MTGVRRVLMTTDTVGGVWTYTLELARALSRHDVEIALASMGAATTRQQRDEVRALRNVQLFESAWKLEWMDDCWDDVRRAGDWLLALGERVRPDCVHLDGYAHGTLPFGAPVVMVGHSCVLSWHEAVNGGAAPEGRARYAEVVAQGLRAADIVVAPTRAMLAALERHYGPFADARVIPNAVEPSRFRGACKEPFVLSAGRLWDRAKNVDALVDVAGRLPWPVLLAGAAAAPGGTQAPRAGVPAGDCTRKLGALPRELLAGWLSRASIYALPARYEPFGLSVLEAALSECALVLADIPSLRENWSGVARLVAPDDRDALARALLQLIAEPARRRELAYAARARARRFAPELMGASYFGAYSDAVLRRNHSGPPGPAGPTGQSGEEKSACV